MFCTMDKPLKKSTRILKRKVLESVQEVVKKQCRPCEKAGCGENEPRCCLQSSDNCCRDGYTSRWYHMSLGEHFCNECFDHYYRRHKAGFKTYDNWYKQWYQASKIRPTIKLFVANEAMPYWLQCTFPKCGKWREVRDVSVLDLEYIKSFECSVLYGHSQMDSCSIEEESCVSALSEPYWLSTLSEPSLLKRSLAGSFLKQFCEEGIGLYPIDSFLQVKTPKWIQPFHEMFNGESSIWPRPDLMSKDEKTYMPHMVNLQPMYLALRNLIVAFWNVNPKEWLTAQKVNPYILCRGLVRIWFVTQTSKLIEFLTRKGVINYGLVACPKPNLLDSKETVIVVGSGISGLSAARHLRNLGIKTVVLESGNLIGGRLQSNSTLFSGAMTVHGLINNPLTVLCHQSDVDLIEIPSNPVFITEDGAIVSEEITERMQLQLSGMMHGSLESSEQEKANLDWFSMIAKHQNDFHDLANFSEVEDQIFDSLLEINDIEQVTNSKDLTKNFEFPLKAGNDGLVVEGLMNLAEKLAQDLDIKLETSVQSIKLTNSNIELMTNQGLFEATRVIVTVPLPILRNNTIKFEPPIPSKMDVFNNFGDVKHERVILQFNKKFWKSVFSSKSLKLAFLSSNTEVFHYFIDISEAMPHKKPTLVAFVTNGNLHLNDGSDDKVIELCLKNLKHCFKRLNINVPKPTSTSVTRWSEQPHICSSGSYIKVGSSYELYDAIAECIDDRIFFAGEATYRKIPNSATGAFLSGLREATNVVDVISPIVSNELHFNNNNNNHKLD